VPDGLSQLTTLARMLGGGGGVRARGVAQFQLWWAQRNAAHAWFCGIIGASHRRGSWDDLWKPGGAPSEVSDQVTDVVPNERDRIPSMTNHG
jgi:hypothetical protein